MGDCEIVLRFFAVRESYNLKQKTKLNIMLDRCMRNHMNDRKEIVSKFENDYMSYLYSLKDIFGDAIFYLPKVKKLSIPMYDALMVAYSLVVDNGNTIIDKDIICKSLNQTLEDTKGYEILTGKLGTSQSIWDRVDLAKKILIGE